MIAYDDAVSLIKQSGFKLSECWEALGISPDTVRIAAQRNNEHLQNHHYYDIKGWLEVNRATPEDTLEIDAPEGTRRVVITLK